MHQIGDILLFAINLMAEDSLPLGARVNCQSCHLSVKYRQGDFVPVDEMPVTTHTGTNIGALAVVASV